jgi:hypothetical protein
MGVAKCEAGIVAKVCANVWLETPWCSVLGLRWLLAYVGPTKVMMGSDARENLPVELAKYRALDLDSRTLDRLPAGTAQDVFNL